jgi:hypothetical protein
VKKNVILFIGFIFSCSAFAQNATADRTTLFMVSDIIKACPVEFFKSLEKEEGILKVTSEHFKNAQGLSVTTLIMMTGYAATPMSPSDSIQNTITVTKTAKAVQPLDGWLEDIICTLAPKAK